MNMKQLQVCTNLLIFQLKELRLSRRSCRTGKLKEERTLWEIEYEDGSKVVMPIFLDAKLLLQGGVDLVAWPQYCGGCLRTTTHDYYHLNNTVKCRYCGNKLGENDERPEAQVLPFPVKEHA